MPTTGLKTATLSGWGQPHDALSIIAPNATHIDYAKYTSVKEALDAIAREAKDAELVIGWSQGGQLAVRAIASGLIKPRALVLIAAPFQFVASKGRALGMPEDIFKKFHDDFARNPSKTLRKAWELIPKNDRNAVAINAHLMSQNAKEILQKNWLKWLELLDGFSCETLDFTAFPPTLLIHGNNDRVVHFNQSGPFVKAMKQATLMKVDSCGHAPHWHGTKMVQKAIKEHLQK